MDKINPIDEAARKEIKETIQRVLDTFSPQYIKLYTIGLVKSVQEAAFEDKGPTWKLEERPENERPILKSGYLTKEGEKRKSWKKRWFIANPDYTVDYFENEAAVTKGKPKGSMSLAGYKVVEDPNKGIAQKAIAIAKKMGIAETDLPKPKTYPPLTFEVHHSRRRSYFIQCANEEEFKQWTNVFSTCCRNAWGLKNQDPVHKDAFNEAVQRTRWKLGHWGHYSWGGSEEQILSDLIVDQLEFAVLDKLLAKIQSGPWQIRKAIRKQMLKVVDGLVSAAVTPAWKTMAAAVEAAKEKAKPQIEKVIQPIADAQNDLIDKIKGKVMSIIEPALEKLVIPHLGKILTIIKSPFADAFEESVRLWETKIDGLVIENKDQIDPKLRDLDWFPRSWELYPATSKLDSMYDPLWALHEIFSDIWPWGLIWDGHDQIRTFSDKAIYTFEKRLKEHVTNTPPADAAAFKEAIASIKASVIADYRADISQTTTIFYSGILQTIVNPPFEGEVIPKAQELISPLTEQIPEAVKDFVDPDKLLEKLIGGILGDTCDKVING